MRTVPLALFACLIGASPCLYAQDDLATQEVEAVADQSESASTSEPDLIDASTLHNNRATDQDDSAGTPQSNSNDAGWVHSSSTTETSSSSTTLTIGEPAASDENFDPPIRDAKYFESILAGRWLAQGEDGSCTVTLTSTRWGNSGYRFNGPAGCPGSLISGVSWALEGTKLVVRGPVSPIVTFRERSPTRWEGSDKDGKRVSLTR